MNVCASSNKNLNNEQYTQKKYKFKEIKNMHQNKLCIIVVTFVLLITENAKSFYVEETPHRLVAWQLIDCWNYHSIINELGVFQWKYYLVN